MIGLVFRGQVNPVFDIDRRTGQIVSHSIEHRDEVEKASGTVIKTDPFLDPAYSHISAVVYSPSDWVTRPTAPGVDFAVIHNENATVKLPHGWLQAGDEYWRDGSHLHSATHSPPSAGPLPANK